MTKNAVTQQTRQKAYNTAKKGVVEAYKAIIELLCSNTTEASILEFCMLPTELELNVLTACQTFMEKTYKIKNDKLKISDINKLASDIDKLIKNHNEGFVIMNNQKLPLSQKVKIAVCGLLGALVGLVLGAVVGSLLGGYGAIPGGFLGLVKGFTVGTAIAGGGCVFGAALGSGLGLFKHKRDVKVSAVNENKNETEVTKAKNNLILALENEVNARKQLRNYV